MLTKEFQDEAVITSHTSRIKRFVCDEIVDLTQGRGAILTMVIRLLLNGWVTDKEKVFLDTQAPEDCLTFLIHGKNYIHPEDVDLFPFEVIETTSMHGGEAIFSHRYQPESMKTSRQPYRIFSAAINPQESEKIILGFFGPSHRLGTIEEDCGFVKLVHSFRDFYAAVRSDLPALRQFLERNKATLLVDRSTGRTVAINKPAARCLERSDRAIVDVSLDQLKYHIKPLLPNYNLKMENVAAADLGLSVVTLEPNATFNIASYEVLRGLKTELMGSAARISLVSNQLADSFEGNHPSSTLVRKIQCEADRLSLAVRQYSFLQGHGDNPDMGQNVLGELRAAVDRVVANTDQEPVIVGTDTSNELTKVAPQGAWRLFFESIIEEHMWHSDVEGCHWIKVREFDNTGLQVRFETTLSGEPATSHSNNRNEEFVSYLASLLNTTLIKSFRIEDNTLLTELIIKP